MPWNMSQNLFQMEPGAPTKPAKRSKCNKKKERKDIEMYVIKQGLNGMLNPNLTLQQRNLFVEFIEKLVQSVSVWSFHAYQILHLYLQHCLDKDDGKAIVFNQSTPDEAFYLASGGKAKNETLNEIASRYFSFFKDQIVQVPLKREGAAVYVCNQERRTYLTAAKNNISVHFYVRQRKWIKLQIFHFFFITLERFPPEMKFIHPLLTAIQKASIKPDGDVDAEIINTFAAKAECTPSQINTLVNTIIKESRNGIRMENLPVNEDYIQRNQNWFKFLPWIRRILSDFTAWQKYLKERTENKTITEKVRNTYLKGFRLFSISPLAHMRLRHIAIDNRVLFRLLKPLNLPNFPTNQGAFLATKDHWWKTVFQSTQKRKKDVLHGLPGKERKWEYFLRTDGISASMAYRRPMSDETKLAKENKQKKKYRKRTKRNPEESKDCKTKVTEEDEDAKTVIFIKPKLRSDWPVIGLDPGKTDIFATSSGEGRRKLRLRDSDDEIEVRKTCHMSTKEYMQRSGATKRKKRAAQLNEELVGILGHHLSKKTVKVTNANQLEDYFDDLKEKFVEKWKLRTRRYERRSRFEAYIESNRIIDMACKRIIESVGPLAWDKKVVIAFGMARFNGTKGCTSAPVKRLYIRLKTVHRKKCIVIDTDEFLTSQKCPHCHQFVCNVQKPRSEEKSAVIYSLKACQKCLIVYDRDDMAAQNIYQAYLGHINPTGRPSYLGRAGHIKTKLKKIHLQQAFPVSQGLQLTHI